MQTSGSASKATRKRSGKEKAEQEGRITAMRARAAEEEEREQKHNLGRGTTMRQAAMVAAAIQREQSSHMHGLFRVRQSWMRGCTQRCT